VKPTQQLGRLVAGIALIGLLTSAIPAVAAPRGSGGTTAAHREQIRVGFILPREVDGRFRYFALSATRQTSHETGAVTLSGSAGVGECHNEPGFPCMVFSKTYDVTHFEMDPSLSAATVEMKRGKTVHRLTLRGSVPTAITPPVGSYANECGGESHQIYTLVRNAQAEGRMFGRDVGTLREYEPERVAERLSSIWDVEQCV
jgi:hypothetical protein